MASPSPSLSSVSGISKDPATKRKRVNRSAKLKQCKLEARREQWLSHNVCGPQHGKESSHNGERGHVNASANIPEEKNIPSHHDSVSSLTHNKECLQHAECSSGTMINPGEERLPSYHEDDSAGNDPGEVIHPQPLEISAGRCFRHMHSGKLERETELVDINSKSCSFLRIKVSEKRDVMRTRNISGTSTVRSSQCSVCEKANIILKSCEKKDTSRASNESGSSSDGRICLFSFYGGEEEMSSKSYDDPSPKSKFSKACTGSRASKTQRKIRKGKFLETELLSGIADRKDTATDWDQDHSGLVNPDDGWEAAADALGFHCVSEKISKSFAKDSGNGDQHHLTGSEILLPNNETDAVVKLTERIQSGSGRAWMQDDIFRPSCLPSLKKQQSLLTHICDPNQLSSSEKKIHDDISTLPPCPICTEDLDYTDSSFDPCPCGFRLCLFCFHRIALDDGRCPGCRKTYNRELFAKSSYLH